MLAGYGDGRLVEQVTRPHGGCTMFTMSRWITMNTFQVFIIVLPCIVPSCPSCRSRSWLRDSTISQRSPAAQYCSDNFVNLAETTPHDYHERASLRQPLAIGVAVGLWAQPPAIRSQHRPHHRRRRHPASANLGPTARPGFPAAGRSAQRQAGGPLFIKSQIIAGTVRRYWVYVPAQYTAAMRPTCSFFRTAAGDQPHGRDAHQQVLENLIPKKQIPVTIGIFITPGQHGDAYPEESEPAIPTTAPRIRLLNDPYARFIVEEILPEVGKTYSLTNDPASRAIGGSSSGGICAFTVAWHRPDQFRNVISMIGSYTSIGYCPAQDGQPMVPGGDLYPTLIRKNPIKPIKIFLQDGSADLDNVHGSWFLANQQMLAALNFANTTADAKKLPGPRYEVKYEGGDGAHPDAHGGSLLPDILRWKWRSRQS